MKIKKAVLIAAVLIALVSVGNFNKGGGVEWHNKHRLGNHLIVSAQQPDTPGSAPCEACGKWQDTPDWGGSDSAGYWLVWACEEYGPGLPVHKYKYVHLYEDAPDAIWCTWD